MFKKLLKFSTLLGSFLAIISLLAIYYNAKCNKVPQAFNTVTDLVSDANQNLYSVSKNGINIWANNKHVKTIPNLTNQKFTRIALTSIPNYLATVVNYTSLQYIVLTTLQKPLKAKLISTVFIK